MQIQADNIITLVVSITLIFLVGGFFLVAYVNLYNEKKRRHHEEKESLKREFAQTLVQSQLEIKEQTLQHISYELHDNLGQVASLIKINLNTLQLNNESAATEKIEHTKELTRQLIGDLKAISVSLGTDRILQTGLAKAIAMEVERLNKTGQFMATFERIGDAPLLDRDKMIILYRMVQEILNNIVKHSGGSHITVLFTATENLLTLALSDDGAGFELEDKKNSGAGLLNLYTRARLIGASLTIESILGNGTQITIALPLYPEHATLSHHYQTGVDR